MRVLLASLTHLDVLARALVDRGLEVTALQPRYVDLGEFGSTRAAPDDRLPYRLLTSSVLPSRPYPYALYLRSLPRLLRSLRPEVLFIFGEPSELGVAQLLRAAGPLRPSLRTVCFSLENLDRSWRGFPRCLRGAAEQSSLRRLDLVLGCSEGVRRHLEHAGYDPQRVRTVYLAADSALFRPVSGGAVREQLRVCAGDFLIGYVGRLVPEKGLFGLLQALALLPPHCRLVIVGSGRAEASLRGAARACGVQERVIWTGRLPRQELPAYYGAFDCVVAPSLSIPHWQEQFGMALAEAMMCGTAVVGSDSGAIPETIGDGGLIFPEGDVEALAARLRQLSLDPPLRELLGERGRARALRHFTSEAHVGGIVAALQEAQESRVGGTLRVPEP